MVEFGKLIHVEMIEFGKTRGCRTEMVDKKGETKMVAGGEVERNEFVSFLHLPNPDEVIDFLAQARELFFAIFVIRLGIFSNEIGVFQLRDIC